MQPIRDPFPDMGQIRTARRAAHRPAKVFLVIGFLCVSSMLAGAQNNTQTPLSPPPPRPTGVLLPEVNRLPDANQQMEMREQQSKSQNYAAANALRKKQIADDTEKLVKLTADLKVEVDKASKDTLSLSVIRKADEIERLAHNIKEKMKLTPGPG